MKKFIVLLVSVIMMFSALDVFAQQTVTVKLDGSVIEYDVPAQVINDRTMVPLRKTFEILGASVEWVEAEQKIIAVKDDRQIMMQIDSPLMTITDTKTGKEQQIKLDVSAMLVDDRTLIPARAVSEAFGYEVLWDESTNTVYINSVAKNTVYFKGKNFIKYDNGIDFYLADSSVYSPKLASMLSGVSGSAYNWDKNEIPKYYPYEQSDIYKTFTSFGFLDINMYEYYDNTTDPDGKKYGENNCAYTFGHKTDEKGNDIVLIAIRGSVGGFDLIDSSKSSADWRSNLDITVDSNGMHNGFALAADKVFNKLDTYISEKISADKKKSLKYVITGHSRGAGVADILEWKLMKGGVREADLYGYNFACPDTVRRKTSGDAYDNCSNVFNICNSSDVVSYIPGLLDGMDILGVYVEVDQKSNQEFDDSELYSWGKIGKSIWFSRDWTKEDACTIHLSRINQSGPENPHAPELYINYLKAEPEYNTFKTREEINPEISFS